MTAAKPAGGLCEVFRLSFNHAKISSAAARSDKHVDLTCRAQLISRKWRDLVSGNGNKLTVAQAKAVEVRGDNNTVAVEATDDITIRNGARNTVTYKKSLTGSGPNCLRQGGSENVCERQRS